MDHRCLLSKMDGRMILDKWCGSILTSFLNDPYFWRSKSSSMGRCDPEGSRTLKRGPGRSKMPKKWSSQILLKMTSLHRDQQYLSNDAKIASNGVRMQKLWQIKLWSKHGKSQRGCHVAYPYRSYKWQMTSCWHHYGDVEAQQVATCHLEMAFLGVHVDQWKSATFHLYDDVLGIGGRWLDTKVEDKWTNESMTCGPIRECHVALSNWPIMAKWESKFVGGWME